MLPEGLKQVPPEAPSSSSSVVVSYWIDWMSPEVIKNPADCTISMAASGEVTALSYSCNSLSDFTFSRKALIYYLTWMETVCTINSSISRKLMFLAAQFAEVLRLRCGTTRRTLVDSIMANVHHRAVRIAAQQAHQRETQRTEERTWIPENTQLDFWGLAKQSSKPQNNQCRAVTTD